MIIILQIFNGYHNIGYFNDTILYIGNTVLILLICNLIVYYFNRIIARNIINHVAFIVYIPFTLLILSFIYSLISYVVFTFILFFDNLGKFDSYIVITLGTLICILLSIPFTKLVKIVVKKINPLIDVNKVFSVCYFIIFLLSSSATFVYSFFPLFLTLEKPNPQGLVILFILLIAVVNQQVDSLKSK